MGNIMRISCSETPKFPNLADNPLKQIWELLIETSCKFNEEIWIVFLGVPK